MNFYHFTNDLRFKDLLTNIKSVAKHIETNEWSHPNQTLEKAKNGWYPVYCFYFGLFKGSNNCKLVLDGKTNIVIGEFIKKFQFPNPKNDKNGYFKKEFDSGKFISPLRTLLQLLFYIYNYKGKSSLTKDEFKRYILANDMLSNDKNLSIESLYSEIERKSQPQNIYETNVEVSGGDANRFVTQLLGIFDLVDYVKVERENIYININELSDEDRLIFFDIISYKGFWEPTSADKSKNKLEEESYKNYIQANNILVEENEDDGEDTEDMKPQIRKERVPYKVSHEIKGINKMYFGAPGTGKSFSIKNFIYDEFKKDSNYQTDVWERKILDDKCDNPNVFRTTLHPEFSYNDFVGQLEPKKNGKSITYDFVPKIFTQALTAAIRHPEAPIFLILEELSRANVAAVFGDIFQLLDRSADGSSEYSIDNDSILQGIEDIYQSYVVEGTEDDREVYEGDKYRGKKIFIPRNLFIIGTVNTSDQNVFVMDTAFKRRFEFEYMDANDIVYDEYEDEQKTKGVKGKEKNNFKIKLGSIPNKVEELDTDWISLYTKLNSFITAKEDKGLELSEDKQLGQFFIKFEEDIPENEGFNKAQLYGKLLQYLWEDIKLASYSDKKLFDIELETFSQAYKRMKDGKNVFHQDFMNYEYNRV